MAFVPALQSRPLAFQYSARSPTIGLSEVIVPNVAAAAAGSVRIARVDSHRHALLRAHFDRLIRGRR